MYFEIGDVEKVEKSVIFIRLYWTENQLAAINEFYSAHFSMTEWITVVVNPNGVKSIVAFSEADVKEYDVSEIVSEHQLNQILCQVLFDYYMFI